MCYICVFGLAITSLKKRELVAELKGKVPYIYFIVFLLLHGFLCSVSFLRGAIHWPVICIYLKYSKTCLKVPLKRRPTHRFFKTNDRLMQVKSIESTVAFRSTFDLH